MNHFMLNLRLSNSHTLNSSSSTITLPNFCLLDSSGLVGNIGEDLLHDQDDDVIENEDCSEVVEVLTVDIATESTVPPGSFAQ